MSIVVRITDGLGNQMFQYACAYALAKKLHTDLLLDPVFQGRFRTYQLEKFSITFRKRLIDRKIGMLLKVDRTGTFLKKYRAAKLKDYRLIEEKQEFVCDDMLSTYTEPILLKGYWQSHKYFEDCYEEIRHQFRYRGRISAKAEEYIADMKSKISVAMHIRRTDYKRTVNNVCLSLDYYAQALKIMRERIGDFALYIFTDDKEFVKKSFELSPYTLVEGLGDMDEFVAMQNCRHHIIANSTFSWWAAYLSENKEGTVIAPVAGIWTESFYLPQWIKLNTQFDDGRLD